jgi:hypothetical protein
LLDAFASIITLYVQLSKNRLELQAEVNVVEDMICAPR